MARLVLVDSSKNQSKKRANILGPAMSEGEEAKRLLMSKGFVPRRDKTQNGQWEFNCPFHEESGSMTRGKATNFYLTEKTSQYYCHAGSCGESGNLQTLENYFGIEDDVNLRERFKSKNMILLDLEQALKGEHYRFLEQDKGLNRDTVQQFRIGWDAERQAYVIPYLEHRRPVAFRFYDPVVRGHDEKGKPHYGGPNGAKYWWEMAENSIHTYDSDGVITSTMTNEEIDKSVLRLFNTKAVDGDHEKGQVFVCEGEFKAMLLSQWGYAAVGIPGVNGFKQEWARYFMNAKEIFVIMDNDNPDYHHHGPCAKCSTRTKEECDGHNPGQEGAAKLLDFFGYRGRNIILPLPDGVKKTDINEYAMRDDHGKHDFARLLTGHDIDSPYVAKSLSEIRRNPPPEAVFLVSNGLLPRGGRLLVTGAPKVGKSIYVENLVLSIAAGIPFLRRFEMANTGLTPGHRVLLLDRELSERSLFDRLEQLIDERPGYSAAEDKLFIDHRFKLYLDQPGATDDLIGLIKDNNAEVVVLDTAYKFFANGDIESSRSLSKVFNNIDAAIMETGASFILTHHHRKGSNQKNEAPSADSVVGSFLWTGWANGTVLLNFKNRSVEDPYTTIASFVAFRDAPAPEPLLLRRDRDSIAYTEVLDFSFDEEADHARGHSAARPKLTFESLENLLMQAVPCLEDEFLHQAAANFGMKVDNIRIQMADVMDRSTNFKRTGAGTRMNPFIWKYAHDREEETYEQEQQRIAKGGLLAGQTTIEEMLG